MSSVDLRNLWVHANALMTRSAGILVCVFCVVALNTVTNPSWYQSAATGREAVGSITGSLTVGEVATYLAEKWKLRSSEALLVSHTMLNVAARYNIDPLLLMAVAAAESSFRHSVGNPGTGGDDPLRPFGIMQVAGRWHLDKFDGGIARKTTVPENVALGAQVLSEYLDKENGDERRALLRYNGSLNTGSDKYFTKVSMYRQQIRADLSNI